MSCAQRWRRFQDHHHVYLRTAISVDPAGWAHFEYVKLPDYRWGIFLAEPLPDRTIGFGDFYGQPVWNEVPGEFRNQLRRLVVTQGLFLAAAGVAVGLVAAALLSGALRSLLFGVTARDPATYASVAAVVLFVSIVACVVPAHRAASVDPLRVLRD